MALSDAACGLERRIEACAPGCIPDIAQRERLRADVDAIAAQLALFRDKRP